MKAYRVKTIGSQEGYLVTEREKVAIKGMLKKHDAIITIGGSIIRSGAIRCITEVNVDLDSCPDYFIEAVKKEEALKPKGSGPTYQKLPTEWILLDENARILSTCVSRMEERRVAESMREGEHFYIAKCHYRTGKEGDNEYITNLSMIPEALKVKPEPEDANGCVIVSRYIYRQRQ